MTSARFFNLACEIDPLSYPQDAAGGEVPNPGLLAVQVPCCVQQTSPPVTTEGKQGRRGSEAPVMVFFRPDNPPGVAALQKLKARDVLKITNPNTGQPYPGTLILDGPPFDASGRGAVWEAAAKDIR
jgi:hypothetical protein